VRLLHVGSGFRPWRRGGLVAYAEDLMDEQVRRGHEVAYFFSGRQYPYLSGPRLRRWQHRGVAMLEVVNSPLYDHGGQPEVEIGEPLTERMLNRVVRDVQPQVVHFQELAGLPSSVLEVVRAADIPTVLTLQDYFPLCSTFRLFDSTEHVCLRREIAADCMATVRAGPREPGVLIEATLRHDLPRLPVLRRIDTARLDRRIERHARSVARHAAARRASTAGGNAGDAARYQRRRDVNISRLNRTDRLVAMSSRVAEIYSLLGVEERRLRTVHLTLRHIEFLRPRPPRSEGPLTFGTLSGLESTAKGAYVLRDALRTLREKHAAGRFRLLVFGYFDSEVADEVSRFPGVELRGLYDREALDGMLDEVDVGVIPSVWEEAYGYVGLELLAKGIPLIGNAIGGIVDYVRERETGWLNRSRSGAELAQIMLRLLERPEEVDALSQKVRAHRESIIKPIAEHGEEMEAIYRELLDGPPSAVRR
jgi:glycosyltransferase involved in cell wall biosynthesis